VFCVDERADAALGLRAGNRMQCDSGLAGGFRTVDFDDTALGKSTDAEATSNAMEPVGIDSMGARPSSPNRMTEPLPNWRSIWARAASSALSRSLPGVLAAISYSSIW